MVRQKLAICFLLMLTLCGCGAEKNQTEQMTSSDLAMYTAQISESSDSGEVMTTSERSVCSPCAKETAPELLDTDQLTGTDAVLHNSISFEQSHEEHLSEDGTLLLYESRVGTAFSADDPQTQSWVVDSLAEIQQSYQALSAQMLQDAQSHYQSFPDTFYSYSNYLDMTAERHDGEILSLLTINSIYSGGAHPSSIQTAYNFDLIQQSKLSLADLLEDGGEAALHELLLSELESRYDDGTTLMLYEGYQDTLAAMMEEGTLTGNWYMTPDALVVYFNQYEIAPYAAGIIKVSFPFEMLEGIIKKEFVPTDHRETGTIELLAPEDAGEEGMAEIRVSGSVQQLQIFEEYWMDGALISSRLVLSIGNPCDGDVIRIPDAGRDGSIYGIKYVTGDRQTQKCYLSEGGLSETP